MLEVVHGRDLWPVKVDISQFEQVIVNLAVNARDAMPEGGRLTVRTSNVTAQESARFHAKGMPAADYVLVEVADTGTGIPAKIVGKIFEPFFSTKEVGKGTGLGLSTVYGIIKQTGGFVYVDSAERKGTTFRIFLPRHIATAQEIAADRATEIEAPPMAGALAAAEAAVRQMPISPGRARSFWSRTRKGCAQLNARGLASRGYTVLEAGNGVEAIEVLEKADGRGRSRGVGRGHAGNGRSDAVARIAQPQSRPEDHFRLRLCRGCIPEASAGRRSIRLSGKTVHAQATGQCRERELSRLDMP